MLWLSLRRRRWLLISAAALVAAVSIFLIIAAARLGHDYGAVFSHKCGPYTRWFHYNEHFCNQLGRSMSTSALDNWSPYVAFGAAFVFPGLLGVVLGAQIFSHDAEQKTDRILRSQSMRIGRLFSVDFLVVASALLLMVAVAEVAVNIWSRGAWLYHFGDAFGTLRVIATSSTTDPTLVYQLQGFVMLPYALLALSMGFLAGAIIRRPGPAVALSAVAFAFFSLWMTADIRAHLLPAEAHVGGVFILPGESGYEFRFGDWNDLAHGVEPTGATNPVPYWEDKPRSVSRAENHCTLVADSVVTSVEAEIKPVIKTALATRNLHLYKIAGGLLTSKPAAADTQCLAKAGLQAVVLYHPASQFWPMQIVESALVTALAIVFFLTSLIVIRCWRT